MFIDRDGYTRRHMLVFLLLHLVLTCVIFWGTRPAPAAPIQIPKTQDMNTNPWISQHIESAMDGKFTYEHALYLSRVHQYFFKQRKASKIRVMLFETYERVNSILYTNFAVSYRHGPFHV